MLNRFIDLLFHCYNVSLLLRTIHQFNHSVFFSLLCNQIKKRGVIQGNNLKLKKMDTLFGVMVPISMFLGLFTTLIFLRKYTNDERMAMIEKGMNPKEIVSRPAPYRNLKWGLLLVGAGVGLFLAYIMHTYVLHINDDNPVMYFSLIGICGGLGLIASYWIEKKQTLDKE